MLSLRERENACGELKHESASRLIDNLAKLVVDSPASPAFADHCSLIV